MFHGSLFAVTQSMILLPLESLAGRINRMMAAIMATVPSFIKAGDPKIEDQPGMLNLSKVMPALKIQRKASDRNTMSTVFSSKLAGPSSLYFIRKWFLFNRENCSMVGIVGYNTARMASSINMVTGKAKKNQFANDISDAPGYINVRILGNTRFVGEPTSVAMPPMEAL